MAEDDTWGAGCLCQYDEDLTDMCLLAKSNHNGQRKTLLEHSEDVLEVFDCLFGTVDSQTPFSKRWRSFFRIGGEREWETFFRCAVPTMLTHDLGKANSGFQSAVRREGAQVLRHEHLSSLLLTYDKLRSWLDDITEGEADIVIAAVVGHHLKAGSADISQPMSPNVSLLHFEPEGLELIAATNRRLGRDGRFSVEEIGIEPLWSTSSGKAKERFSRHCKNTEVVLKQVHRRLQHGDNAERRLLIALRSALIVADSAASGLTRERKPLLTWLTQAFDEKLRIDGVYIRKNVIQPRKDEIEREGGTFSWHQFQEAAAELPSRSLMLCPCGSGKTLAAWRWIERQLEQRPTARVIFLYPTRATATEGFRDYMSWAPEADVSLMTGTAAWELRDGLFENPGDERGEKDFTTEARLFALGYWHRRIFSATIDQFLGFMQNSYASICLLPMLVDSVLVIDEVHSFDRNLFAALKKFLEHFDVPALCMTASLPGTRRDDLEELGLKAFPTDLSVFSDLADLSHMPRYRIQRLADVDAAASLVNDALTGEKPPKVLWVVNTVARCQALAKRLAGPNTLCYHSAFTLADRKDRHQELVRRFQVSSCPLLAVTTQVCEMSLDLDADVLVTEDAPITSLIQRMGRCNRHARLNAGKLGDVYVYKPPKTLPYDDDDLIGTEAFLRAINGSVTDQMTLQALLTEHGPDKSESMKYAAFLECGPYAVAREENLRDIDDRSVQAILSKDIDAFLRLREAKRPTDGFLLPAPRLSAGWDTRLGRFPQVVESSLYTKAYGLERNREVA